MSDLRNLDVDPFDPNNPDRRDPKLRRANVATGWVVAAIFAVAILAVIFGLARQPGEVGTNTAANDVAPPAAPPAATHMAPPPAPSSTPSPGALPQPPLGPPPSTPAHSGDQ